MRKASIVKRAGTLKEWVTAVMASGRALFTTAELHLMRNAVAWKDDEDLAQRAAQLEAELAQVQLETSQKRAQLEEKTSQKKAELEASLAAAREASLRV